MVIRRHIVFYLVLLGLLFLLFTQYSIHIVHDLPRQIIASSDTTDDPVPHHLTNLRLTSQREIAQPQLSCSSPTISLGSTMQHRFLEKAEWIQTSKDMICHSSSVHCSCDWATPRLCGLKEIDSSPCNAVCCCEVMIATTIERDLIGRTKQVCTSLGEFALRARQLITDTIKASTSISAGCGCDWVNEVFCDPRTNDGSACWRACCTMLYNQQLLLQVEHSLMTTKQHSSDVRRISFPITAAQPPWNNVKEHHTFYFQDVDDLLPNQLGSTHTRMPLKRTLCRTGLLPTLCAKTTVLKCVSCLLSWYVILSKDGQYSHNVWSTRADTEGAPITLYESESVTESELESESETESESGSIRRTSVSPPTLDIGIPWGCSVDKLTTFLKHFPVDIHPSLDARLLITNFQTCKNSRSPNKLDVADIIRKYANKKLKHYRVIDVPGSFQRAHGCNVLHDHARDSSILTILDVDMRVQKLYFRRSLTFASKQSSIYTPIAWSRFNPLATRRVSKYRHEDPKVLDVVGSTQGGKWRVWGAGNYAISGSDAKKLRMNEKFLGWGGEDDDFLARASKVLNVVRARDPYIVHNWHPKDCSKTEGKKRIACIGSMAEYEGSALSFVLDRRAAGR